MVYGSSIPPLFFGGVCAPVLLSLGVGVGVGFIPNLQTLPAVLLGRLPSCQQAQPVQTRQNALHCFSQRGVSSPIADSSSLMFCVPYELPVHAFDALIPFYY